MLIASCARIFDEIKIENITWSDESSQQRELVTGDVVKVQVISEGRHPLNRLETLDGAELILKAGDEFIGVIGSRAALDFLSGSPPESKDDLIYTLNIGGVLGRIDHLTYGSATPPEVRILGRALNSSGEKLNTINSLLFKKEQYREEAQQKPHTIIIAGEGRSSGKTTTASEMIRNLSSGYRVGAVKLTGASRLRDIHLFQRAGAGIVADFSDVGLPSSIVPFDLIEAATEALVLRASQQSDILVCELGSGFYSEYNVEAVLKILMRISNVIGVVLCSTSRSGTYGNIETLHNIFKEESLYLPYCIAGPITNSLSGRNLISRLTDAPIFASGIHEKSDISILNYFNMVY